MELTNEPTPVQVNPAFLKVQPSGSAGKYDTRPLVEAQKILEKQGFQLVPDQEANHSNATVYSYVNPHTTQRANLSHHFRDNKGRPIDEARLGYFMVKQPKRRTPEQKRRDNFVLYD